ncbi:SDR family oxidoreductase [Leucobacter weissii]|uniref:SDR family oxidoreductase n=1 Tax=Leucobacter weissii TaxID=1983706 RepID=A0A939MPV7_9MICO|nr:SDR family oxidoreductase [Leucobacter weissii]
MSFPTGGEDRLRAVPDRSGERPRVLVLGATGYVGGRLVPRLLAAGYRIRVLSRSVDRVRAMPWRERAEIVEGDASDPRAVSAAMRDVDIVYYLMHSMNGSTRFSSVDRRIARNVARAAEQSGVRRMIYLGGLAPDGRGVALSPHLASRREVGRILLRSEVATVVLQAGVIIGSGSASFEMIRHLTEVLPVMPAPRWVRNLIQPIAIRDVLYYLLASARVDGAVNRAYDIGGPDVLRYGQMMNGYAVEAGLPQRRILALPVLTPRLASHWVGLVTPVPRKLARPLVESLQHDCVMKDRDIDGIVPPPEGGLTRYRRAVRLALGRMETDVIETSWVDAALPGAPSDPLPSDPDWAGRTVFTDERTRPTTASAERLWAVIEGIGGANGWYSPALLWSVRGWMDRLVGGVGLRRGRRSRARLAVGDAVDFWRVEAMEPGRMLRLRAEMKLPGTAWLEIGCVVDDDGGVVYTQQAIFFPSGLTGRLYWLGVVPFHGVVFSDMARRIVALAEEEPTSAVGSAGGSR